VSSGWRATLRGRDWDRPFALARTRWCASLQAPYAVPGSPMEGHAPSWSRLGSTVCARHGRDGARPCRPQMQRQAFLSAPLAPAQAALLEPPPPLRPQPRLLSIHRPWHPSPRLRALVNYRARTQAPNPVKNGDGVRLPSSLHVSWDGSGPLWARILPSAAGCRDVGGTWMCARLVPRSH
jgi:hypothetical protein